ncbi:MULTISPECIES: hypothetical protein [unclassified Nocardia]|uniref:hypothetical protein n=1 Tax=unclassified Nocardia TaxID=2637762 RepID=UPI0035DC830C
MWYVIVFWIVCGSVLVTVFGALIYFEIEFRLALRRLPKDPKARRAALRRLRVPEYRSQEIEGPSGVPWDST